jgi:hypothetical protein
MSLIEKNKNRTSKEKHLPSSNFISAMDKPEKNININIHF